MKGTGSDPPRTLWATLGHLGPGIILASSIVGSGESIAATTVGAEAGLVLLWLIVIGCAIKVAAQIEIGRTTLAAVVMRPRPMPCGGGSTRSLPKRRCSSLPPTRPSGP